LDELTAHAIVFAAGGVMGFVNNLAGAGGALALLAFDLAAGLPPSVANASMRPAAVAIAASGALGFRSRGQPIPPRALGYALWTLPGALLGTLLAIRLPTWVYEAALFAVVTYLGYRMLVRAPRADDPPPRSTRRAAAIWFGLVGLHMGFLQVGVGLLAILALSHVHSRDLVHVNVAKMALVAVSSVTSLAVFACADVIAWQPALWLAAGAGIGSFVASRFSVAKGHGVIRGVVLLVCALVLIRILLRFLVR
jgi:uncharacterized membrane protein YfcA